MTKTPITDDAITDLVRLVHAAEIAAKSMGTTVTYAFEMEIRMAQAMNADEPKITILDLSGMKETH